MDYFFTQKIKKLKAIKPNKDWVSLTKKEILGEELEDRKGEAVFVHWFLQRPVYAISLFLGVVAVGFGVSFLISSLQSPFQELTSSDYSSLKVSLGNLEASLNQTTLILKGVKEPKKVLEVEGAVKETIEKGQSFISRAKQTNKDNNPAEVLSAISGVESALSEMENANNDLQKEVAQREMDNLKQSSLSEKQTELLKEAEDYFDQGSYPQALAKIVELSQSR